jgi:hypothetical protein
MNPRRVHELMRQKFPEVRAIDRDWVVAADESGLRREVVRGLIAKYIVADELLVEVHRRVGDFLSVEAAIDLVAEHVGQGEIRISDREFTGYVVVAVNGVAAGWTAAL